MRHANKLRLVGTGSRTRLGASGHGTLHGPDATRMHGGNGSEVRAPSTIKAVTEGPNDRPNQLVVGIGVEK